MKSLIFTAKSSFARFRCPHTTTSALTFSTIHPVAVRGLIGAVVGIDYKDLYEYSNDIKIGIQVLNKVYKDTQSFNLIPQVTTNKKSPTFISRIQFLRDVKYRIFLSTGEEKLNQIENILKSKEYVFTPYLGCSEHIAKLEYEKTVDIENIEENYTHTLVPKDYIEFDFDNEFEFYVDRIPTKNNKEREYIEYENIVFSPNNIINIKNKTLFKKVGEYNVFFF
ncbi:MULTISPECIES: type I-B CRISPR-associated protein Cas5b [Tepidibacter]|jgi:CRISPR-associated protein Cas5h|uniref:CRISPR-associated protein, Cas5h family n=2 Tax=Tepidibacter TaxID=214904 RepID=A0A1M5TE91_9FIRM|nr:MULTISPECIES: type I-B CRISPR-associated protein Cas5b [Tepidibacter]SHH49034.1 CRISPR-associated protein, Cas5h family [Tepidibacter thalassicus DSM 15285]SHJ72369.1 CRISPR-associated protein, Cas5h family [Tepidibacter formicigenes DSM 15518]